MTDLLDQLDDGNSIVADILARMLHKLEDTRKVDVALTPMSEASLFGGGDEAAISGTVSDGLFRKQIAATTPPTFLFGTQKTLDSNTSGVKSAKTLKAMRESERRKFKAAVKQITNLHSERLRQEKSTNNDKSTDHSWNSIRPLASMSDLSRGGESEAMVKLFGNVSDKLVMRDIELARKYVLEMIAETGDSPSAEKAIEHIEKALEGLQGKGYPLWSKQSNLKTTTLAYFKESRVGLFEKEIANSNAKTTVEES
jgi:hypothetical protein